MHFMKTINKRYIHTNYTYSFRFLSGVNGLCGDETGVVWVLLACPNTFSFPLMWARLSSVFIFSIILTCCSIALFFPCNSWKNTLHLVMFVSQSDDNNNHAWPMQNNWYTVSNWANGEEIGVTIFRENKYLFMNRL